MARLTRILVAGLAGASALTGAALWGWTWWTTGRFQESTDDAYLKADYTTVAPKVSGYLINVLVADNQVVRRGQVLARIDARDYKTALARAKAKVSVARSAIRSLDAELILQHAVIDQAKANIAAGQAALKFSQADYRRYRELGKTHYIALQTLQQAQARLTEGVATVRHDRAALVEAQRRVEVVTMRRVQARSTLQEALAAARQAALNVGYTAITAPIAGTVGDRTLRIGQYVQAGTSLMAIVPLRQIYVIANFKETQLTRVRPGQPATVRVDSFPGVMIQGHVDSLSPASGLEFALLPPDNATGNFTKVVQRIPVKITLEGDSSLIGLLRPGMSVEPSIDTRPAVIAAIAQRAVTVSGRSAAKVAER